MDGNLPDFGESRLGDVIAKELEIESANEPILFKSTTVTILHLQDFQKAQCSVFGILDTFQCSVSVASVDSQRTSLTTLDGV